MKDSVGNVLEDGDTVTIVKDLKVKGAGGGVVKVGTKVRGIRLITDGVGDHDIDAKVPASARCSSSRASSRKFCSAAVSPISARGALANPRPFSVRNATALYAKPYASRVTFCGARACATS